MTKAQLSALLFAAGITAVSAYAQEEGDGTPLPEVPTPTEDVDNPPQQNLEEEIKKDPALQGEHLYDPPTESELPPGDTSNQVNPGQKPTTNEPNTYEGERGSDSLGLLGPIRIGPTVQIGVPHPLTYGVEAMVADVVSLGFSTGKYHVKLNSKGALDITSWDAFARWHPFAGSFFLGVAYGHQDLSGTYKDDVTITSGAASATMPAEVDVDVKGSYFSPRLGWFAVYNSGLVLGFELGAQIPVSPSVKVEEVVTGISPAQQAAIEGTQDYKDLHKKADDAARIIGKKTLPYVSLLKIGWMF